jgi:hypothetical protein
MVHMCRRPKVPLGQSGTSIGELLLCSLVYADEIGRSSKIPFCNAFPMWSLMRHVAGLAPFIYNVLSSQKQKKAHVCCKWNLCCRFSAPLRPSQVLGKTEAHPPQICRQQDGGFEGVHQGIQVSNSDCACSSHK